MITASGGGFFTRVCNARSMGPRLRSVAIVSARAKARSRTGRLSTAKEPAASSKPLRRSSAASSMASAAKRGFSAVSSMAVAGFCGWRGGDIAPKSVMRNTRARMTAPMSDETTDQPAAAAPGKPLTPAAKRALAEAAARHAAAAEAKTAPEDGGPKGLEPTRFGDWERKGLAVDF